MKLKFKVGDTIVMDEDFTQTWEILKIVKSSEKPYLAIWWEKDEGLDGSGADWYSCEDMEKNSRPLTPLDKLL